MCTRIQHRGPDDRGTYITPEIAIGMQRLSVIDVEGGHQPISNEDGDIYNYPELRSLCEARSHQFSTNADTEVIIHLYEKFGESFLDRLNGMFAFALIDGRTGSALLARDRLRIKPLYYTQTGNALIFGSEIKAVLFWRTANGVKRTLPKVHPALPILLNAYYYTLLLLAALAVFQHRRNSKVRVLLGTIVLYTAVYALLHVRNRYRVPLLPIVFVLTSGGAVAVYDWLKNAYSSRTSPA